MDYDFISSEHYGGFHDKVEKGCYECYKENRIIQAHKTVNDPFSFENVSKMVGNINRIIYGIDPFSK